MDDTHSCVMGRGGVYASVGVLLGSSWGGERGKGGEREKGSITTSHELFFHPLSPFELSLIALLPPLPFFFIFLLRLGGARVWTFILVCSHPSQYTLPQLHRGRIDRTEEA